MKISIGLVLSIIFITGLVFAEDFSYKTMTGSFFMWGEPNGSLTPDSGLKGFSLFIDGKAADTLYNQMAEKPYYNECYDDGTLTKSSGNFECHKTKSNVYSCGLGVDLKTQKIYVPETC